MMANIVDGMCGMYSLEIVRSMLPQVTEKLNGDSVATLLTTLVQGALLNLLILTVILPLYLLQLPFFLLQRQEKSIKEG